MLIRSSLLLLVVAMPALAQMEAATIGDRIRVHAPESGHQKLIGVLTATTPEAIAMKVDGAVGEFAIPRDQILFMYRSTARHRNTKRGFALGVPIGIGLGIWFGPKAKEPAVAAEYRSPVPRNALVGAASGAVLGTAIGYLVRTDTWVQVRRQ